MSVREMDPSTEEKKKKDPFEKFLTQRRNILKEIKEFLLMVLNYFFDMEQILGRETVVTIVKENLQSSIKPLIESLYLLHGLYGYPAETDELPGTVINRTAIKNIFLNKIKRKIGENEFIYFVDYCGPEIRNDNQFWEFTFGDETFRPESLPREPAHYFLQLVRDVINTSHDEEVATVGRTSLEALRGRNGLRPTVWAYETEKKDNFGVSLGVRSFVRPLYLCIKLTQLSNVEEKCKLENVKAIKIQDADKDVVKDPCVSCQKFFGFQRFHLLGNCAEYDVIGKVNHTGLLQSPEWREFRSACEQHFDAFKEMRKNLKKRRSELSSQDILKEYHRRTRNPKKPKVLRYEWNPKSKGGFELKLQDPPIPQQQNEAPYRRASFP